MILQDLCSTSEVLFRLHLNTDVFSAFSQVTVVSGRRVTRGPVPLSLTVSALTMPSLSMWTWSADSGSFLDSVQSHSCLTPFVYFRERSLYMLHTSNGSYVSPLWRQRSSVNYLKFSYVTCFSHSFIQLFMYGHTDSWIFILYFVFNRIQLYFSPGVISALTT